jgi:hypothetical protein
MLLMTLSQTFRHVSLYSALHNVCQNPAEKYAVILACYDFTMNGGSLYAAIIGRNWHTCTGSKQATMNL